MKSIRRFLYFNELKKSDYIFCIILLFLPFLLVVNPFNPKFVIFIAVLLFYIVCIVAYELLLHNNERYDKLPIQYRRFVYLSIFNIVATIIFRIGVATNIDETSEYFYFVVVVFALMIYSYLFCLIQFLLGIGTFFYYFILKLIFPEESSDEEKHYSPAELSKYISITDQRKVLNTIIVNLFFYILGVAYIFLWGMANVNNEDEVINTLVKFAERYNNADFGNTVGLISLIITIYTVTYSIQGKIYEKAVFTLKENEK